MRLAPHDSLPLSSSQPDKAVEMLLHLHSRFFVELTLHSLVYTAPFVAPLAFTGLGFTSMLGHKHLLELPARTNKKDLHVKKNGNILSAVFCFVF